jgi:hypothetical protein
MWYKNRVWIHYIKNIVAADVASAVFLASYIKQVGEEKEYLSTIEIYDLQKYRVIRDSKKIQASIREKLNKPFIFIASKN